MILKDLSLVSLSKTFSISNTHLSFQYHEQNALKDFDYAIEIGFLPGVTDNIGNTARESIEDLTGTVFMGQGVYSSQIMYVSGNRLGFDDAQKMGELFANPLIQSINIKSREWFMKDLGMGNHVPKVIIICCESLQNFLILKTY